MKRKILLFTLAIPVILCQNALAQTSTRLVAQSNWSNNGATFTPVDTSYYYYTGIRGGDLKHTLKFDSSYTWTYSDSAYQNEYFYVQSFDANNNILSKITEFWTGTSWELLSNTIYTYNSSNQMTTMILQSWNGIAWAPVSQDAYSYNSGGFLQVDLYQQWNPASSMFTNTSQKTYYYDTANNLINQTDQSYSSGTPIYTDQYAYTYSSTNQLLTAMYNLWNGSGWSPNTLTTNTYDTLGDQIDELYQTYDASTSTWVNNTLDIFSGFTAAKLPTMDIHQTWSSAGSGSWMNATQYTYTYNSNNQMTSYTGESWNIVGIFEYASGDPMSIYYYEPYATVTSVTSLSNTAGDARVYPVPAQNTLNVDLNWTVPQSANITLYNVQGAIVRQWSTPNAAQYHTSVSVDNLSEGAYFLNITGTQGQIVKQVVVAH